MKPIAYQKRKEDSMMLPILVASIALVLVLCKLIPAELAVIVSSYVGIQSLIDAPLAESVVRPIPRRKKP